MFNQGYMLKSCHLPFSLQKAKVKLAAVLLTVLLWQFQIRQMLQLHSCLPGHPRNTGRTLSPKDSAASPWPEPQLAL